MAHAAALSAYPSPSPSQILLDFIAMSPLLALAFFLSLAFLLSPSLSSLFRLHPLHSSPLLPLHPSPPDRLSRALLRDRSRHRRLLLSDSPSSFTLGGTADPNLAGLYFIEIELGTPPSKYYVQVDTGSDLLWVNCASCRNCPTVTQLGVNLAFYDPKASTTSRTVGCADSFCSSPSQECQAQELCVYQLGYGDGSTSEGYFINDVMQLNVVAGNKSVAANASVAFGCGTRQGGDLQDSDQALDGIMGFGQSNLSVISQLENQNLVPGVFAHCLEGEGNGGGILVIGEVQAPGLVYTPILQNQPHYNVNLKSIDVNGVTIPIDSTISANGGTGTIIDSGTTLAYFADDTFTQLQNAILTAVQLPLEPSTWEGMTCVDYAGSIHDLFPPVTFKFQGAVMTLQPQEYMIAVEGQVGKWCIGFQSPGSNNLNLNILGDLVLKDRLVVYDLRQPEPRIGWVDYDCNSNVTVKSSTGGVEYVFASSIPMASVGNSAVLVNRAVLQTMLWLFLFILLN